MVNLKEWRELWNDQHIKFAKEQLVDAVEWEAQGSYCIRPKDNLVGHRNKMMVLWIVELLSESKLDYYTTGGSNMDDETYDWFENNLRVLDPENDFLNKVGYQIDG